MTRDIRLLQLRPWIANLARRLRIPTDLRADCIQAGNLAALVAYEHWDDETTNWGTFVAGSLKLSVTRDMLREMHRGLGLGYESVQLDEVESPVENEEGEVTESGQLPIINEDNLDLERSKLMEQLIDHIVALQDDCEKALMLLVLEGRTVSEAGRILSISQSAADRLYQRTVAKLRNSLGTK